MKASEAREITDKALGGSAIQPALVHVYGQIQVAAEKGERSINVDTHFRSEMSHHQREALWARLKMDGYDVKHHSADQRDPRERDWTQITW